MSGAIAALATGLAVACWPASTVHRLRLLDGRADPRMATRHLVAVGVLAQVGAVILGVPYLAAGCGCAAVGAERLLRRRRRLHERRLRRDAVAEVVFALAAELQAGRTPAAALESAAASTGALRQPLGAAARAVRAGAPAAEPLRVVAGLPGCEALAAVAAAWQVTEQAGGAVADVLDRLGQTLDADAVDRRSFEAVLAGPRASMALLVRS